MLAMLMAAKGQWQDIVVVWLWDSGKDALFRPRKAAAQQRIAICTVAGKENCQNQDIPPLSVTNILVCFLKHLSGFKLNQFMEKTLISNLPMRLFCEVSALSFLESGNWIVWSNFLSKNLLDIFIKHSILYIILQEYLLVGLSPVFVFGLESEENLCAVCICVFLQCSECNVKRVFCNVQCAVGNVHVYI